MKQIKPINRAIADYTAQVSEWKKEGGRGDVPPALLEQLAKLGKTIVEFYKGREPNE